MAVSGRTRWFLILPLLVILAAGVSLPLLSHFRAKEVEKWLASIPGNLKAGRVSVGLLQDRLEITGLSGRVSIFEKDPLDISADAIIIEGVNWKAAENAGPSVLAERITVKNSRLEAPQDSRILAGFSSITVADSDTRGFAADYKAFTRAAASGRVGDEFVQALMTLRSGPSTFTDAAYQFKEVVGSSAMRAFLPGLGPQAFSLRIGRGECEQSTLNAMGPFRFDDIEHIEESGVAYRMKTLSADSMKMPPALVGLMFTGMEKLVQDPAISLHLLVQGCAYKNLKAAEVLITFPEAGLITIPDLALNLELGGGALDVKVLANDIETSPQTLHALLPAGQAVSDALGNDLLRFHLDFALQCDTDEQKNATLDFHWKSGEKRLGDLNLEFSLKGRALNAPGTPLPIDIATTALVHAQLEAKDREFLHFAFLTPAWSSAPENSMDSSPEAAEARRAALLGEIADTAGQLPENRRALLKAYAAWIGQSGVLTIDIRPEKPFPLLEAVSSSFLSQFSSNLFDRLNISVIHTPPAKQD